MQNDTRFPGEVKESGRYSPSGKITMSVTSGGEPHTTFIPFMSSSGSESNDLRHVGGLQYMSAATATGSDGQQHMSFPTGGYMPMMNPFMSSTGGMLGGSSMFLPPVYWMSNPSTYSSTGFNQTPLMTSFPYGNLPTMNAGGNMSTFFPTMMREGLNSINASTGFMPQLLGAQQYRFGAAPTTSSSGSAIVNKSTTSSVRTFTSTGMISVDSIPPPLKKRTVSTSPRDVTSNNAPVDANVHGDVHDDGEKVSNAANTMSMMMKPRKRKSSVSRVPRERHKVHHCTFEGCTYNSTRISNLQNHLRVHTGEKPFICDMCPYASGNVSNLRIHKKRHHKKKKKRVESAATSPPDDECDGDVQTSVVVDDAAINVGGSIQSTDASTEGSYSVPSYDGEEHVSI